MPSFKWTMFLLVGMLLGGCSAGKGNAYLTVSLQDAQIAASRKGSQIITNSQTTVEASEIIRYTVVPGDTLYRIAQATGVSVEEIAIANSLADPSAIQVGQVLLIPVTERRLDDAF